MAVQCKLLSRAKSISQSLFARPDFAGVNHEEYNFEAEEHVIHPSNSCGRDKRSATVGKKLASSAFDEEHFISKDRSAPSGLGDRSVGGPEPNPQPCLRLCVTDEYE